MRFKNVNAATDLRNNSVTEYHSIPRINWRSFRGRREEKWGSIQGLHSSPLPGEEEIADILTGDK